MIRAVWVEIPVKDIARAKAFYEAVFELDRLEIEENEGVRHIVTMFRGDEHGKSGVSLTQTENFEPCDKGVFVYFNTGENMPAYLERVKASGGKIVADKTSMGEAGFYGSFLDTEGNLIGLYGWK